MWAVLKINNKNLETLKADFTNKLGKDVKFYIPKVKLKKFLNRKIYTKEMLLLGDYLLCFHKDFTKKSVIASLKYSRGLKYFLNEFCKSQNEIEKFIFKCKENEDKEGFIKFDFFEYKKNRNFEFISGPFTNMIFKIINEKKFYIKTLIGNYRVTVSKEKNLFRAV